MPVSCSTCGAFVIPPTDEFELKLSTLPRTLARLSELAATNEAPREPELALIRPIVEKTSARLAAVDAEIRRLKDRLRELEAERNTLFRYHAQSTPILSPLRRMPAEILGEIFSWTLPPPDEVFNTKHSPWVLTHVCGGWRAVALAKSSLWSIIHVDFAIKPRYPLEMIRIQIQRASTLKINFYGSQHGEPYAQIGLFKLLAEHSVRWEELSIQLTSYLVPHVTALYRNLPALRRAWVQWHTIESQTEGSDSVDFLRMAISLVDIGAYCEYRFLPTHFPMGDRLIRYDFDASLQTHCNLLKALPNLEEARIRRRFDEGGHWPEPGEPVNVLNLRRLYVNNPIIFNYLRAPALEELAIQLESTSTDRDIAAGCGSLEGFLMRSSCSPRRLVIDGVFPAQSTAAILQKHPSFTEIAVIDPLPDEDISAFLALFTISDSTQSESVFPHINNLGFACCNADGDAILYPLFLDMLNSRASVGRPALKVAELLFTNSSVQPDPLSATRLETLRESALQLSLLFEGDARSRVDEWLHNAEWCSLFPSRLG